jgi:serine/threonine protein kinase
MKQKSCTRGCPALQNAYHSAVVLAPGIRFGGYEIVALIGAGGMGEVYRARDARLNRDVAIKIVPDFLAGDPDRLARFDREAQIVASLNHANIAHIYGIEDAPAADAALIRGLVMELVDGPTLADRIAEGPLAIPDALAIAHQIAAALEAAHESDDPRLASPTMTVVVNWLEEIKQRVPAR